MAQALSGAAAWLLLGTIGLLGPITTAAGPALAIPSTEVACRGDGARVAMLVGNGDYAAPMQPLDNPKRDVAAFGSLLCGHGFTVFRSTDLGIDGFDAAIENFAAASKGAKTALVYYSGHGFAAGRQNWLAPTDAKLSCEDVAGEGAASPRMTRRLVDLDRQVFDRLDPRADQIVILDACRTNPVAGCRGGASPSLVKGFSRTGGGAGRLVVYATQDGQVALDGVEGSPTSPLMTAMTGRLAADPRRDWVSAMLDVSDEVATLTRQRQRPNLDISLRPKGCLAASCEALKVEAPVEAPDQSLLALIEGLSDRAVLDRLSQSRMPALSSAAAKRIAALPAPVSVPGTSPAVPRPPVPGGALQRDSSPHAVQFASTSTLQEANAKLAELSRLPDLKGRRLEASTAQVAGRTAYRVRTGPMRQDEAGSLCAQLKAGRTPCVVVSSSHHLSMFEAVGPIPGPSASPAPSPALLTSVSAQDPGRPVATAGGAVWSSPRPLDAGAEVVIDIPGALKLEMIISRNSDTTLPASHVIDLRFTPAPGGRGVREVGVPTLIAGEGSRPDALAGLSARVADNVFLLGLSDRPSDIARNVGLLNSGIRMELPLTWTTGERAVLRFDIDGLGRERLAAVAQRGR